MHFDGLPEAVATDIADGHKFFRRRGPRNKLFARHGLDEGHNVMIGRLSAYGYRTIPLGESAASRWQRPSYA